MTKLRETSDSRITKGDPPVEATFKWHVLECQDEEQAIGFVYADAPTDYRGLAQDRPNALIEKTGYDTFLVTLPYILLAPGGDGGGGGGGGDPDSGGIIEFDTTGGTQHLTQCVSQAGYGGDGGPDICKARVVGLTRDGVEGVDIVIPKLEFVIPRVYPLEAIDGGFIRNLSRLTGKMNSDPYILAGSFYDPGELLFLGASGRIVTKDGEQKWEIDYRFSASENRKNIIIREDPEIKVLDKKGHDYLWVLYKKDEADNRFVEVPDLAFVSRVYEEAMFALLLGVL